MKNDEYPTAGAVSASSPHTLETHELLLQGQIYTENILYKHTHTLKEQITRRFTVIHLIVSYS